MSGSVSTSAARMGWEEGLNDVGNMWFDTLLDREPETYAPLVGHPGIRPVLEGMMGRQCQLRSFRAYTSIQAPISRNGISIFMAILA